MVKVSTAARQLHLPPGKTGTENAKPGTVQFVYWNYASLLSASTPVDS